MFYTFNSSTHLQPIFNQSSTNIQPIFNQSSTNLSYHLSTNPPFSTQYSSALCTSWPAGLLGLRCKKASTGSCEQLGHISHNMFTSHSRTTSKHLETHDVLHCYIGCLICMHILYVSILFVHMYNIWYIYIYTMYTTITHICGICASMYMWIHVHNYDVI